MSRDKTYLSGKKMVGLGRLLVLLAVMAISGYWILRLSLVSRKREALEIAWNDGASDVLDMDAYVQAGMAAWEDSLPARMLWTVLAVPYLAIGALVYFVN